MQSRRRPYASPSPTSYSIGKSDGSKIFISFRIWFLVAVWVLACSVDATILLPINEFVCDASTTGITNKLFIQFSEAPVVANLSHAESIDSWSKLKDAIATTYNSLSFHACDLPYFRTVEHVALISQSYATSLDGDSQDALRPHNSMGAAHMFELKGHCRNCTNDLPWFDPSGSVVHVTTLINAAMEATKKKLANAETMVVAIGLAPQI